jgi:hypothetical protein
MKLVLAALMAAQVVVAGDSVIEFLPANTKVVMGIRVAPIVDSALFKDVGADVKKLGEEWLKVVAITGFDPLHDIDEIVLASPADNEKAQALLVVRGRFDLSRMGAGSPRYHGVAMVGGGKDSTGAFALLDATTVLAGDTAAVHAAIDRRGQPAILDRALAGRLQALRERFDIWGTGERPEGFVAPTGKNEQLDSLDRFEFGVRLTKGFALDAELHARSPKDAEKLAASLQLLKAMATMKGPEQLAPTIDVQVTGGTVKISLDIPEESLKKALAARRGAGAPVAAASGPPVIVSSETSVPVPGSQSGGTTVFTLPGKK